MANHRLVAIITALMMLNGSRGGAEASLESLREMNALIDSERWGALREYIMEHPEVLTGTDALSEELRNFIYATTRAGNGAYAANTRSFQASPGEAGDVEGEIY